MKKKRYYHYFWYYGLFWLVVTILNLKNVVGFLQYIRRSNEKCIGLVGK